MYPLQVTQYHTTLS